jgi:hypothetical protein
MKLLNSQQLLSKFKRKYGYLVKLENGNPKVDFSKIKFRPGAPFTTPFHIDTTTWDYLRIHMGIDRGHGSIYNPFDSKMKWYPDYGGSIGSLLRIFPEDLDAEIRIFHIDDLTDDIKNFINNNKIIPGNRYIAETGVKGLGTGAHSHVEIVSLKERSAMLDELLRQAYHIEPKKAMTDFQIKQEILNYNDDRMTYESYLNEKKQRRIIKGNNYAIEKIDYFDNKKKTWYSSKSCFNC